jgi:hypothetical protein
VQRLAWVLTAFLLLAFQLGASPCIVDTLANYVSGPGCTIGPQTVAGFSFSSSVTGGATAIADTDITVSPTSGPDYFGVIFSSTDFTTSVGTVTYNVGFTWDSIPIVGMGDALDPGNVTVGTGGCEGVAFVGSSCSGTLATVNVSLAQTTDVVTFPQITTLGILNSILLDATGGTATFTSIENDAYVIPEPASVLLCALGLAILAKFISTNG